jgi:deferrochelatase/peroxidase EfeB
MRTVTGAPADLFGSRCPLFAHIRKVNPRDRTTDQGGAIKTLTFQMMRRGVTWGAPYPPTLEEQNQDDGDRGLLFLSYQTSIENQFELLNNRWMNREAGPESGGHDLLVGQGNSGSNQTRICRLKSSQGSQAEIRTLGRWVIPTGGGYFFAPSLSALRHFAAI